MGLSFEACKTRLTEGQFLRERREGRMSRTRREREREREREIKKNIIFVNQISQMRR